MTPICSFTVSNMPRSIAIDPSGNVWVAGKNGNTISKLSPNGVILGIYSVTSGTSLGDYLLSVAIDTNGNVWVLDFGNLIELSSSGSIINTFYDIVSSLRGGDSPDDYIAIDHSGNVWVVCAGGAPTVTKVDGVAPNPQYFPYGNPVLPYSGE